MKRGIERLDLLQQSVGQFLPGANRHGRNVVNRLVGVNLEALSARVGETVNDVDLALKQPKFEHLKQANRTAPTLTASASMISTLPISAPADAGNTASIFHARKSRTRLH